MAAAQARLAVSPYARRLARERGLPLATLRGTGPSGRILAADVLGFIPVPLPENRPATAPAIVAPRIAAFAASVSLRAMRELLVALENSGKRFEIDDMILRAVGYAFDDLPDVTTIDEAPVALELNGRQAVFSKICQTALTSLRTRRLDALSDTRDETTKPAALSLRLLPPAEIRPLTMPLLPSRSMRLIVSADAASDHAECLLTFDAAIVDEGMAAAWLAVVKSAIENPLRLFV